MAVFYLGPRPVTKGRNDNLNINPYTGKVNVYSNWSIFNPSHVLDGAPNTNVAPGSGLYPHALQMSRRFRGLDTKAPMDNSAAGPRVPGYRFRPLENKAVGGARVFQPTFGHIPRITDYSEWDAYNDTFRFRELPTATLGHVRRTIGAPGTANSFGTYGIYTYHGASIKPINNPGVAIPTTSSSSQFGHNRVNQWFGVTSAKALKV